MLEFIRNITSRRDEDGASAVEYGLLVAGIAALIVAIVFLFGGVIKDASRAPARPSRAAAPPPPPADQARSRTRSDPTGCHRVPL